MKILVFLQGTILVEQNVAGNTREESVARSRELNLSKGPFGGMVPIGGSVAKLTRCREKGATILYLTASRKPENVLKSLEALNQHGLPEGELFSRGSTRSYAEIAQELGPDIIVENDCKSIGGEKEMVYPNMTPEARSRTKSVVVREFEGIDHLPDDPKKMISSRDVRS